MEVMQDQEQKRRKMLEDHLTKQVECPVCLEVPRKGPIYTCPNGHLVCKKCKQEDCPICREAMGRNKSLVAVEIIEKILHKCKFVNCKEKFPLGEELAGHEKTCKHRIVNCPYIRCDEKFALSCALEHIGKKSCSYTRAKARVVDDTTLTVQNYFVQLSEIGQLEENNHLDWKLEWYIYRDIPLVLCVYKSNGHYHFYVVMFESAEVCSGYTVELEVYKKDATPQHARHNYKFRGNPVSIDAPKLDIEHLGLLVHHKAFEKMVLKDDAFRFTVSFSFL